MKTTNQTQSNIELALTMYKENVSPSETYFQAILSQIPEQQKLKEGRAIRSPYRWLVLSQAVTVFTLLIAVIPTYLAESKNLATNPYYETDRQIEAFEEQLNKEDYENGLRDYVL